MCNGVPIFADNKKALFGKGTNSHSTSAEALGISEDSFRKYEFHWWTGELVADHYDAFAENLLSGIDKDLALKLAERVVKKHFSTKEKIAKWLKGVPDEWSNLQAMKPSVKKTYLFKQVTGYTPSENKSALAKKQVEVKKFVKRVEKVSWFKPAPVLSKIDIQAKVDFSLSLFNLPKVSLSFKYLRSPSDWGAAWDAARDAESAAGTIIASDLKAYKSKYSKNPFMPLFDLWEMGLYPIGVNRGKFLIYVPMLENGKKPKIGDSK